MPVKAEYCHEVVCSNISHQGSIYLHELQALRLVLHAISTSAARYGRYIHPVLSLSIDFYVRMFVQIHAAPLEVKKAYRCVPLPRSPLLFACIHSLIISKTSVYYVCSGCQSFHAQPLGKVVEKTTESSSSINLQYKTHAGPPVSPHCEECGGVFHVGYCQPRKARDH